MTRTLLPLVLIALAFDAGAVPVRRTVVLTVGERITYEASAPISIVSLQPGAQPQAKPVVRYQPEQYGRTIGITGLVQGEAVLLVQDTAEQLADVVHVVVASATLQAAYRRTVEQWRASSNDDIEVHAAPPLVVIAGTAYSARTLERCAAAESAKSPVVCAMRLAPVVSVVGSGCAEPRASLELVPPSAEGGRWNCTIRIADVPVLAVTADDVTRILNVAGNAVRQLNRALLEWRKNAASGTRFPTTFTSAMSGDGYELSVQWSARQGRRGERLTTLRSSEFVLGSASGDPSRALAWEVALLTDVFRLYTLGRAPATAVSRGEGGLEQFYRTALRLAGGSFEDWNCAAPFARSFVSLRWSTGAVPLQTLATRIPDDFRQ